MLNCECPEATALTTIPYPANCDVFGKDGRWFFQRLDDANNEFVDVVNGIELQASWSAQPTAVDDTKIAITPLLEEVEFALPDILEDSENYDGAPIAVSSGPQKVTGIMRNPSPAQTAALRDLECGSTPLTVYRIDNNGNFGVRQTAATPAYAGIKISPNTFVLRGPFRGTGRVDMYKLQIDFYLPDTWYDTFAQVAPEAGFDPLTEVSP